MEKLLDQDARIKRAEEIYLRRQNLRERTKRATVSVSEPKNFKLLKRIILQIVICTLIYFIFYLINTTNYSFSEITLSKTNELISNDEDFARIYANIVDSINKYIEKMNLNGLNIEKQNNIVNNENSQDDIENQEGTTDNQTDENQNSQVNGTENQDTSQGEANTQNINSEGEENNQNLNQENTETTGEEISYVNMSEADRIKNSYSFIVPASRRN